MISKKSPVQVNDTKYASVQDAAKHFNVSCKDALDKLENGMSPEQAFNVPKMVSTHQPLAKTIASDMPKNTQFAAKPIFCGTDKFESIAAFAKHFGMKPDKVRLSLHRGATPEELLTAHAKSKKTLHLKKVYSPDKKSTHKRTFQLSGLSFDSIDKLAEYFHINIKTLNRRLNSGWSAAQAVGLVAKPKRAPDNVEDHDTIQLVVGEKNYRSVRDVATSFNIDASSLANSLAQGLPCEDAVHNLIMARKSPSIKSPPKQSGIIVNGERFTSERAAAVANNISLSTFYQRRKKGMSVEDAINTRKSHHRAKAIMCHGKEYTSMRDLAKQYDISPHKLRYRIEYAGMSPEDAVNAPALRKKISVQKRGDPIHFNGKQYASVKKFAEAYNVGVDTVTYRLNQGWSRAEAVGLVDRIPIKKLKNMASGLNKIAIKYKGQEYRSVEAFAEKHGLTPAQVRYRLKEGWSANRILQHHAQKQLKALSHEGLTKITSIMPVTIEGKVFDTATSLAEHYGLNVAKVTGRLRNDWSPEEAVELKPHIRKYQHSKEHDQRLKIGNNTYANAHDLSKSYNASYRTVKRRLEQGATPAQAVGRRKWTPPNNKGKSVTYNGKQYPSYAALAKSVNVPYSKMMSRIHRNWPLENAVSGVAFDTLQSTTLTKSSKPVTPGTHAAKNTNIKSQRQSRVKTKKAQNISCAAELLPEMNKPVSMGNLTFSNVEDFAEHLSLDPIIIFQRLQHGWKPEQIAGIEEPPNVH
jgi:hypothetical protein